MFLIIVILSLVVYRVTRFLIEDDLISEPRTWLQKKIAGKHALDGKISQRRIKLLDFIECPYCVSVWVAAGTVLLASWVWTVPQPFFSWLAICGGTMVVWRIVEVHE